MKIGKEWASLIQYDMLAIIKKEDAYENQIL